MKHVLLLSSDIECGADSKLNFFEITNKFLKDIYEAQNITKLPLIILCEPMTLSRHNTNQWLLQVNMCVLLYIQDRNLYNTRMAVHKCIQWCC